MGVKRGSELDLGIHKMCEFLHQITGKKIFPILTTIWQQELKGLRTGGGRKALNDPSLPCLFSGDIMQYTTTNT